MNLYHYCSNSNFISIVQNASIRLSSLSLSNDYKEGKLLPELLIAFARDSELDDSHVDRLKVSLGELNSMFDGLGFCLSEERDLLSQWRGYADDANGVAIGFSKEYIEELSSSSKGEKKSGFSLEKIEYDINKQKQIITPTFNKINELVEQGAFGIPGIKGLLDTRSKEEIDADDKKINSAYKTYSRTTLMLLTKIFLLKSPAFREEKEWRLISYFLNSGSDLCEFYSRLNAIVPFREYKLNKSDLSSIVEVVLGPKNMTPPHIVKNLLSKNGFEDVDVTNSEASYR